MSGPLGGQTGLEFHIEPLIGYRTWSMTEALDLRGVVHAQIWPSEEDATALCIQNAIVPNKESHRPNDVPVKDCQCGFYAYWTTDRLRQASLWSHKVIGVRGAVIGWGKGVLAEHGWRAKKARPVALLDWPQRRHTVHRAYNAEVDDELNKKWSAVAARIAERYNIPLLGSYEELEQAAAEYLLSR